MERGSLIDLDKVRMTPTATPRDSFTASGGHRSSSNPEQTDSNTRATTSPAVDSESKTGGSKTPTFAYPLPRVSSTHHVSTPSILGLVPINTITEDDEEEEFEEDLVDADYDMDVEEDDALRQDIDDEEAKEEAGAEAEEAEEKSELTLDGADKERSKDMDNTQYNNDTMGSLNEDEEIEFEKMKTKRTQNENQRSPVKGKNNLDFQQLDREISKENPFEPSEIVDSTTGNRHSARSSDTNFELDRRETPILQMMGRMSTDAFAIQSMHSTNNTGSGVVLDENTVLEEDEKHGLGTSLDQSVEYKSISFFYYKKKCLVEISYNYIFFQKNGKKMW
ncbi:hypothetical protein RFI_37696 [Reticulomyxa filosa]|uniref:Uncharacterized protein n=1 Tax=Reticulomyxa filosa TaxID=46433 RepID=X6LF64_RETFI|nr:hypothetical protein RFI_37696 [Reticulomyxa filosa]|eukprot:ETN99771.1 hypothetical protein RFI_37696 [Reticulomyxa filosa]